MVWVRGWGEGWQWGGAVGRLRRHMERGSSVWGGLCGDVGEVYHVWGDGVEWWVLCDESDGGEPWVWGVEF
jgi:hypothetical protein